MELNEYDYDVLEAIANYLENITTHQGAKEIRRIVRKLKRVD